ncbi:hypothetical protein N2152v2_007172 [Parachlorella kessleri]
MDRATEAAREGNSQYFHGLAEEDLRQLVKKQDDDGRTLLHAAATSGSLQLVQFLVDHGAAATVNSADEEGWSPLMSAASAGHEDVVKLLLSLGADLQMANNQGRTSLHYAVRGRTCLMTGDAAAAGAGRTDAARVLIEEGRAKVDVRDKQGATPLLLAAQSGAQSTALYLASRGADVEAEDKEGDTPLGAAASHGKLREALVAVATGELDISDALQ